MATLIITRGLQGSGKTTRAKAWVAENPTSRARVNRDDLRSMVHNGAYLGRDTERRIMAARDAAILALLRQGVDVINDDTNLPSRVVRDLARLATQAGATVEVWDLTDVSVDECVRRDAAREHPIGEQVIRDLHARYLAGKGHPLPLPEEPADSTGEMLPYVPQEGAATAVMVDIDGTVALMGDRSPYDETLVHRDQPNWAVVAAVRAMNDAGHEVIFCSGRTDGCREATEKWLAEHVGVQYVALYMRKAGDTRKDAVVKLELFDRHIRHAWNVVCVFDDRDQVVTAWRSIGLTVFQVAPGDF